MDEIRDVAKRDQGSRFLDNRTLRVQPFGSNVSAERAYRRAERLVAAIHLVTNHVAPDEPVRRAARLTGLDLLSSMLMLKDQMRNLDSSALKKTQSLIRELISLARVLSVAGHVSSQNAETLVEALDELGNFLVVSQRTPLSEAVSLDKDELLDTIPTPKRPLSESSAREQRLVRDKSMQRGTVSNRAGRKGQRTERIVGILTNQGQLAIKDITVSLPEYSEKMIQRELKSLITLGRVKKMGSKRWSTYALA